MKDKQKPYTILHFDSNLFGYAVGRINSDVNPINLSNTLKTARREGLRLLYWFVDPKDDKALEVAQKYSGCLASEKVTYRLHAARIKRPMLPIQEVSVYKHTNLTKEIRSLALQCGIFSRFATDRHFVRKEYIKLYTIWIKKSVNRAIAFTVLVYRDFTKKVRGFITLERKNKEGHIGLFVVDKNFRGRSIGNFLMQEALRIFVRNSFREILVTTQDENLAARTFYKKFGFTEVKREITYHFWL